MYSLVPSEHCKLQPAPQVTVRPITEDLAGETVHQKTILPHSSTVRATASHLCELEAVKNPQKDFDISSTPAVSLSYSALEHMESRLRASVSMLSHANPFLRCSTYSSRF